MDIVTIVGTSRPGNYTSSALQVVEGELHTLAATVTRIDSGQLDLRFPGDSAGDGERIRDLVTNADGIVFATPEYHGTFASRAKLVIENLGFPSVLAGKPIALLGVAAGGIGAIKALEHLRSTLSHVGAIVLPNVVSIASVHKMFDEGRKVTDTKTEERLKQLAQRLVAYIEP